MNPLKLPIRWLLPFLFGVLVGGISLSLIQSPSWHRPLQTLSRRVEATIYLPTVDNDRQPFSDEKWQAALQVLVDEFGGATLGPPMEGCWAGKSGLHPPKSATLHIEPVRPVTISFEPGRLKRFQELVRQVGRQLGQESTYTRYEEPRIELADVGDGV